MTLRHISPRSVEWYEAILDDEDEALTAHDILALRTMKALEDAEIRVNVARGPRAGDELSQEAKIAFGLSRLQVRHA